MRKPFTPARVFRAVMGLLSISLLAHTALNANPEKPIIFKPQLTPASIEMMGSCPGCGPNLAPNGGYEDNTSSILGSSWKLGGSNGSRTVRLTTENSSFDDIDNWLAAPNIYYVKKDGKTNNPEGEYFVWLPNKDQCFNTTPGVIGDLNLCPGRPYTICFKAAAWKNNLVNWVPQATIPAQKSSRLNIEFSFEGNPSNLEYQTQFPLPTSSSWSSLNWQTLSFSFIYDPNKPLSSIFFTNAGNTGDAEVGVAIDDFAIYADDCSSCPQVDWTFGCDDNKKVDLYGKSSKDQPSTTLPIPDPASIYQTVVEVIYKGTNPGTTITIVDNANNNYLAYRITPLGGSSSVWVYRAMLPSVSSVKHTPPNGYTGSVQSIVAYAFRNTQQKVLETGVFTNLSGYNNLATLNFKVPLGSATRNVDVELPISELTNDGRYLMVKATAAGISTQQIVYGSDPSLGGCCLNIIRLTIPNVPANTTDVQVVIDTRHNMNGQNVNGQSYVISGAVRVAALCASTCPVAVQYNLDACAGINPFDPSIGLNASYLNTQDCGNLTASKIKRLQAVSSSCSSNTPFQSGKSVRLTANHLSAWADAGQKAFAFTVTIPQCVEGSLSSMRFWNNSPYKDENGSYNGYPAKYGFRILKNGTEVYQLIDLATSANAWFQAVHFLENIPALTYTGGETFTFEYMAYGPTGNGNNVWLVDQFEVFACCSEQAPTPNFAIPDKICKDNPSVFIADNSGNGVYTWNFGAGAMPATANGIGPHFVTWPTSGPKTVTLTYGEGTCQGTVSKTINVENCDDIKCGLISVTVNQNSDCYTSTGKLHVDVCESCGTSYPITVYYKQNGIQKQAGPFNNDGVILTNLPPGVYSDIYIVDNKGCNSNKVGPITIIASGLPNVSAEKCEVTECIITDKLESDGKTRTFWLPGLPNISDPRFKWDGTGSFEVFANGTAKLSGTIRSVQNNNCGFNVVINLANRRTWPQWSALGRSYKGCDDNNNGNNNYYQNWEYYEIVNTSKLTGFGCYSGSLTITHKPANYNFGFQIGQGANVFNCDVPGVSAWFMYQGTLNSISYSGEGDINALGGCGNGINDPSPEIPILTCPPCKTVACDASLDPASLGNPVVNCENLTCNLTYTDTYNGAYPLTLTRTWTAACGNTNATCKQDIILLNSVTPEFAVPDKNCKDNPSMFVADNIGNGTYSWNFGPDASPQTASGIGPHFITWSTAGTKTVTLTYESGPCDQTISKQILVEDCDDIECGLISVTVNQNSDCYSSTGKLHVDVCESCGTTYPITVYYKQNGVQKQAGPFNNDGVILTDLPPGVYTDIYIVDNKGCTSNKIGPITIIATGLPNVSTEKCEVTECIITNKLESDGKTRSFWLPGLPNISDPRFKWDGEGSFEVFANGTAKLSGKIISVQNNNCGFDVVINLANRRTWAQWSALGRTYKSCDDNSPANNNYYQNWEYYEILNSSKLTGFGCYTGSITITHKPANFDMGFQIGQGANAFNCDVPGLSAWFFYNGSINNKSYSGHGDINALGGCGNGINDPSPEIPVLTCPPCKTVECDAPLTPGNLGNPIVNCENLTCNVTYTDAFSGTCPKILTRTWKATCGIKIATCEQKVTILDTKPPILTPKPADVTVECHQVPTPPTVSSTDNCGATVTYLEQKTNGSCVDNYTLFRTWTATDVCGNTDVHTQKITVKDSTIPSFTGFPSDITVECNAVPSPATPTGSDNCDNTVTVTYLGEVKTDGNCLDNYTLTRTWKAEDNCGNTFTKSQKITVIDSTKPSFTGFPADQTVECSAIPAPATPGGTDNCDNSVTVIYQGETKINGSCTDNYTLTRVWKAEDNCGNTFTKSQIITVKDTTKPTFTGFPNDVTVECSSVPAAATPGGSDNCDNAVTITYLGEVKTNGSCTDNYTLTRTWKAEDNCSNTFTKSQKITVVDTTKPSFSSFPSDVTVECSAVPAPATPVGSDNCDNAVTITYLGEVKTNGSCTDNYTLTRTWKAEDNCGNTFTRSQKITVIDTTIPSFSGFPVDVTVECSAVPTPATPGGTDNCDLSVQITYLGEVRTDGNCLDNYTLTRTWKAEDNCGNTFTKSQKITVKDSTNPSFTNFPPDLTIECSAVPGPATPGGSDNCDNNVTITYLGETRVDGNCADNYTLTRTWKAEDNCGNTLTRTQKITVSDNSDPQFTGFPADVTVECSAVPAPATPGGSDNCDNNVTITYLGETRVDGNCADNYTLTRTWKAEDNCGHSITKSQKITVKDTTPPVVTCPAGVTIECSADFTPAGAGTATSTDNCDPNPTETYTDATLPGNCADNYTIVRTWKSTDRCGNTSTTCNQQIKIQDTTKPVVVCPAGVTIECSADFTPAGAGTATSTDNCDPNPTETYTDATLPGNCADNYTIVRTWKSTDRCGNTSTTCNQQIKIQDTTKPVVVCPAGVTIECSADFTPAGAGTATSTDNCDPNPTETYTDATLPGNCADNYTIVRTWKSTDRCGNTSTTCNQQIKIQDTTKPVVVCPAGVTIECSADFTPAGAGTATSTDNCDPNPTETFTDATLPGNCADNYTIVRTWKSTDRCGNTSTTCNQQIKIQDTTKPVVVCPAGVTIECSADFTPAGAGTATSTDNCDPNPTETYTDATLPGNCADNYTIVRTWKSTDRCGNTSTTCNQQIKIQDTTPPVVVCPAGVTIECSADFTPAGAGTATSTDNCDPNPTETYTDATLPGNCADNYTIVRTWKSTDRCGNTSTTCNQQIKIQDTTKPVVVCPAGVTIECSADFTPAGAGMATSTDNCDPNPTETYTDATLPGNCADNYSIVRTWKSTDRCGNTSTTCNQQIKIQDTTPPVVVCPAGVTIECSADFTPAGAGTATST
ncbi:MAG: hypothetical protein KA479_06280, partial [Saprospiraceae bacterium]|nr:hypothetical protein [Saprospiraceae bacterium]